MEKEIDSLSKDQKMVIKLSWLKKMPYILASALGAFMGILILCVIKEEILFGYLMFILCSLATLFFCLNNLVAYLYLDDKGFFERSLFFKQSYCWSDILWFEQSYLNGVKIIGFSVTNEYEEVSGKIGDLLRKQTKVATGNEHHLYNTDYSIPLAKLVVLLNQRLEKNCE